MIYYLGNPQIGESEIYKTCDVKFIMDYFRGIKNIQVDTETEFNTRNPKALPNPYENKILCYQLGDSNNQFVIDNSAYPLSMFKSLFEDNSKLFIFTNGFFDVRFFWHYNIELSNIWDCFLVERILSRGIEHEKGYLGLTSMCKRYCNVELSKEVRGEISWRGLDTSVIQYAANDVVHMENIMGQQLVKAKELDLVNYINLEHLFLPILAKISYKGFKIDTVKWLNIAKSNESLKLEYLSKLDQWLIDNKHDEYFEDQLDMFSDARKCLLNWASSKQVIKLFKKIGINVEVRDKIKGGTKNSVEGKHLIKQKNKFAILPIYLKFKEISKELSTYGEKFIKDNYNPISGRVHSEFFQVLSTGRISSTNPNLQNISATEDTGEVSLLRKCFVADKGNTLVIGDYSSQEPRILADKSEDPILIDFIVNGDGDIHSLVATMISEFLLGKSIKVTKKDNPLIVKYNQKIRDIGKVLNLKLNYGGTAFTLKDDLETTQEEAQKLINVLKSKFPVKEKYFKQQAKLLKANGFIQTDDVTGAKTWFNGYNQYKELLLLDYEERTKEQNSTFYKLRGEMERMAMNFPIQATAGLMTKYATILFNREIKKLSLNAFIVNLVHDEIVVESSIEHSIQVSKILVDCMIKAGNKFCKTVPMKVDPIITTSWEK